LCPLILAINSTLNLLLLANCYPASYSKKLNRATFIFEILCWITLAIELLAFVFGIVEETNPDLPGDTDDHSGLWVLFVLFFLLSSGIYLIWMQIILRKTIHRNTEKAFDSFLKH
jgi:amino acid transporter